MDTTSTTTYSKSACRIKMQSTPLLLLLLYITYLVACQSSQLQLTHLIQQVTITANEMASHNKAIVSKSTGSWVIHRSVYHTSNNVVYIDWCIIHQSEQRFLPVYHHVPIRGDILSLYDNHNMHNAKTGFSVAVIHLSTSVMYGVCMILLFKTLHYINDGHWIS